MIGLSEEEHLLFSLDMTDKVFTVLWWNGPVFSGIKDQQGTANARQGIE
jgi:hypothetical protein